MFELHDKPTVATTAVPISLSTPSLTKAEKFEQPWNSHRCSHSANASQFSGKHTLRTDGSAIYEIFPAAPGSVRFWKKSSSGQSDPRPGGGPRSPPPSLPIGNTSTNFSSVRESATADGGRKPSPLTGQTQRPMVRRALQGWFSAVP